MRLHSLVVGGSRDRCCRSAACFSGPKRCPPASAVQIGEKRERIATDTEQHCCVSRAYADRRRSAQSSVCVAHFSGHVGETQMLRRSQVQLVVSRLLLDLESTIQTNE